jgi:transposase
MLTIIYHLLKPKEPDHDLGGNYFDAHDRQALEKRLLHRLRKLGYDVALQPSA